MVKLCAEKFLARLNAQEWSDAIDCVTADDRSDCNQPRFGQCVASGTPTCVEWDTITNPPFCSHARQYFQ